MYLSGGDILGFVCLIFFFVIVIACCSSGDAKSSSNTTAKRTSGGGNNHYGNYAHCECPSCGAPFYDGYCDECGYPDVNQGWLGENY